jgi:hypothetical protein
MATVPFSAGIVMRVQNINRLVSERVALRSLTQEPQLKTDEQALERHREYKYRILEALKKACKNEATNDLIMTRFTNLAESLEYARGVAILSGKEVREEADGPSLQAAWRDLLNRYTEYGGRYISLSADVVEQHPILRGFLHPLVIALLAYRMGGPINAADTGYAHKWKCPNQLEIMTAEQSFHMEGEDGKPSILDVQRLTWVWEEYEGKSRSVRGQHNIFQGGQGVDPRPLTTATLLDADSAEAPSWIMYDPNNSSLYYDCMGSSAERHCISLDFHVQSMPDDMLDLMATPGTPAVDPKHMTLTSLMLSFPVKHYHNHFHRLLFSPNSLQAIVTKLSAIDIPKILQFPTMDAHHVFEGRVQAYLNENRARIPAEIFQLQQDVRLSGIYENSAIFLERLYLKARRELHTPLGLNMMPQTPIEEDREWVRKMIRDLPADMVRARLFRHTQTLTTVPFTEQDLLPVLSLQQIATSIEMRCRNLIGKGYIDEFCVLPSLSSFAAALFAVLSSPKEADVNPMTAWVNVFDMQVFRTRCMYLFWCADWLEIYYARAAPGPYMVDNDEMEGALKTWRGEMAQMVQLLLRNWVACGFMIDSLPEWDFFVGQGV